MWSARVTGVTFVAASMAASMAAVAAKRYRARAVMASSGVAEEKLNDVSDVVSDVDDKHDDCMDCGDTIEGGDGDDKQGGSGSQMDLLGYPVYDTVGDLIKEIRGVGAVEYTAWIMNESLGEYVLFWGQYGYWTKILSEPLGVEPTDFKLWEAIRKASIKGSTIDLPTDDITQFQRLMLSRGAMSFPNSRGRGEPYAFAVGSNDLKDSAELDPDTMVIAAYLIGNGPEVEELVRLERYHLDRRFVMMQAGNIQEPHIDANDCGTQGQGTKRPEFQGKIHSRCSKRYEKPDRANALRHLTIGREIGRTPDAEGGVFRIKCPEYPDQPENLQTYREPELKNGSMRGVCSTLFFHPHVYHMVTKLTSGVRASYIRWLHDKDEYPSKTIDLVCHNIEVLNELGRFGVWGYGHSPATLTKIARLLANGQFELANKQLCVKGMAQINVDKCLVWTVGVPTDIW